MHEAGLLKNASIRRHGLWIECLNLENPIFFNAGTGHLCSAGCMAE